MVVIFQETYWVTGHHLKGDRLQSPPSLEGSPKISCRKAGPEKTWRRPKELDRKPRNGRWLTMVDLEIPWLSVVPSMLKHTFSMIVSGKLTLRPCHVFFGWKMSYQKSMMNWVCWGSNCELTRWIPMEFPRRNPHWKRHQFPKICLGFSQDFKRWWLSAILQHAPGVMLSSSFMCIIYITYYIHIYMYIYICLKHIIYII